MSEFHQLLSSCPHKPASPDISDEVIEVQGQYEIQHHGLLAFLRYVEFSLVDHPRLVAYLLARTHCDPEYVNIAMRNCAIRNHPNTLRMLLLHVDPSTPEFTKLGCDLLERSYRRGHDVCAKVVLEKRIGLARMTSMRPSWVDDLLIKRKRCLLASVALFRALLRQRPRLDRNLCTKLGCMVWATREHQVWFELTKGGYTCVVQ